MSGMQSNSIILYVFLLFGLIRLKNMTVPDPCPNGVDKAVIADMCSDMTATEEEAVGTIVDSVVLRVVTKQDNCYCYVTVQNYTGVSYAVYMRKYEGKTIASPTNNNCGLAIDIDYPNLQGLPDETESRKPIKCTSGTSLRAMTLIKDGKLEFRSRMIDGSFTRGYCMQIFRQHSSGDTSNIKIQCTNPTTTTSTSSSIESATTSTKLMVDTTSKQPDVKTTSTETTRVTDEITSSKTSLIVDTTSNVHVTEESTHGNITSSGGQSGGKNNGLSSNLYFIIGASAGGVIVLIIIVILIFCIRNRSSSHQQKHESHTNPLRPEGTDDVYDGLKDNVLYVSADDDDVNFQGIKQYNKEEQGTSHLSNAANTNDLTYSYVSGEDVLNKRHNSNQGSEQNSSQSNFDIDNGSKMQPGNITDMYTVVDKSNKNINKSEVKSSIKDNTYAVVDKKKK